MLKVDRLAKHFATAKAVDDVSLEIPEGQMVGIIGRSGAGKSTLLRLINRLIEPTGGRLSFEGRDITALKGAELRRWRVTMRDDFPAVQSGEPPRRDDQRPDRARRLSADAFDPVQGVHAGGARDGDPCAAPPRHGRAGAAARRDAIGRPAAAGGDRTRPDAGAGDRARRRADRLARPCATRRRSWTR